MPVARAIAAPTPGALAAPDEADGHLRPAQALGAGVHKPRQRRVGFVLSVVTATSLHAALLGWFLTVEPPTLTGGGGDDFDAISVALVTEVPRALQAVTVARDAVAAPSAALDIAAGSQSEHALPANDAPPEAPKVAAAVPDAIGLIQALPKPPEPVPPPDLAPRDVARADAPAPPAPAADQGGATATSLAPAETAQPSAAAVAVSAGSIETFARSVIEALSRSRQTGATQHARGTVRVVFAIQDNGALAFARVSNSSGNTTLDAAALATVQRVAFPKPPTGLTLANRTYEIPIRFR
jgi:TonB family protein